MITTSHIRAALRNAGADLGTSLLTFDTFYRCPSLEWVRDEFAPAWNQWRDGIVPPRYDAQEKWDCDDYARLCHSYACLCNLNTLAAADHGLAFGVFAYMKGLDGGHVLNAFIIQAGSQHDAHFFEPQTGQVAKLPREHIELCVGAYF